VKYDWFTDVNTKLYWPQNRRQDSSVGIATGWTADEFRFDSRQRQEIFLFSTESRPALWPTQPPIQCVPGFFPYAVIVLCLIKHRDDLTLLTFYWPQAPLCHSGILMMYYQSTGQIGDSASSDCIELMWHRNCECKYEMKAVQYSTFEMNLTVSVPERKVHVQFLTDEPRSYFIPLSEWTGPHSVVSARSTE
jgi:hypothetical protein